MNLFLPLVLALAAPAAVATTGVRSVQQPTQTPVITSHGRSYATWSAFVQSRAFTKQGLRCGTPAMDPTLFSTAMLAPSDCSYNSTTVKPEYDPGVTYTIPVVVHVIQKTGGQGYITPGKVQSQIDILNEDFLAMLGTNGAPGTDAQVQFELATVDPSGAATTGITYSTNNTWFNDGGAYWNTLAWDTKNYLNIYTNNASGALGYVPGFAQAGGLVGAKKDRVVILWSAFGKNAPIGAPYNKGRTATHEVGHYLGLFHTFDGGCGSNACYSTGDTICDTNRESQPTYGCAPNKTSCGSADPVNNYMDYSDDLCMWEFTPEQVNRMRCTLENWRPDLGIPTLTGGPGTPVCFGDGSGTACPCLNFGQAGEGCANSTGSGALLDASGTSVVIVDDLVLRVSQAAPNRTGVFLQGSLEVANPLLGGILCVGGSTKRLEILQIDGSGDAASSISIASAGGVTSGQTRVYQLWYRDTSASCNTGSNLSNGYSVLWQ